MDGFEANIGVIILAATNRPEVLDPALRRPGRFDRTALVDLPDRSGRAAILRVHLEKVQTDHLDVDSIAVRTPGFSGADLANLVNEAALLAARNVRLALTTADCMEAMERVVAGLEKRSRVLNHEERDTVAHHEAGHAIVGSVVPGMGKVEKISIVPRGAAALGYTLQLPEEDRFLLREDEVRGHLASLLGGRAGEEVAFGRISTGASDDIQKATDLAERCVTLYGMSPSLGTVALERAQNQFLDGGSSGRRAISPQSMEAIDREIRRMLDEAHHAAVVVLQHNHPLLDEMAAALLEHEVLEGDTLRWLLARAVAPPDVAQWVTTGGMPHYLSLAPGVSSSAAVD
jgi:cell division protease FtsH